MSDAPTSSTTILFDAEVTSTELQDRPTWVACPWCHQPVAETVNLDGQLLGWAHTSRGYRCEPCALTIHARQDSYRA